jgi:conserved domain protein
VIEIEFLGPIGVENLKVEAKNLGEVKAALSDKEELKKWLNICAVAVNDEIVNDINFALKEGDKISILPPVCGG